LKIEYIYLLLVLICQTRSWAPWTCRSTNPEKFLVSIYTLGAPADTRKLSYANLATGKTIFTIFIKVQQLK